MRLKKIFGFAAALLMMGFAATQPAEAFGLHRTAPPAGWGATPTINHWVYYPRYAHVYRTSAATDPYAYQSQPRGYYPYYGSHYWVPAHELKARGRTNLKLPAYHSAWGYPKSWHHRQWHAKNHGFHHRWHW